MTVSWLWLWSVVMFVFLFSPDGHGWGYRVWGPPSPRYVQRRRSARAARGNAQFDHHAWGRGGDFIWIMLLIWIVWFGAGIWSR